MTNINYIQYQVPTNRKIYRRETRGIFKKNI